MRKTTILYAVLLAFMVSLAVPASVLAGTLEDFVHNMSIEAKADPSGFKVRLRTQFEVGGAKVDLALSNVEDPADAYMLLKVGEVSGQPLEKVIDVYKVHKDKGWGYIAKQMGIKPGSPEFHALKGGGTGKPGNSGKKSKKGKKK